ncbi:MAG TPA: tyrosine--tRNA ligase [Candidatus Megaira endosymbiont of Nemacystus decipiens]|nr:tyrosine--tRNA ligase [Candidatus Megaera endosymbiont of Nemacystus decipiens]
MNFLEEFKKRGYFHQCSNEKVLLQKMTEEKIVAYIGFDCTAKSLHVGNLMQIMILRLLQKHGHKPIILVGGATTKIGDPTGKDKTRKMLSESDIAENMSGIKKSLQKFIKFGDGESDAIMLDNSNWLEKIGYIEFLRKMGKEFSVNRMLTMESVKLRLEREQSLTFLEFNYMLLQAYDFYHLNQEYNCCLQLGGSDQWGNILMGTDLIHKTLRKDSFALTTPLLTTSSGKKMGKSENGAVWINADQLTPYDYFQYWRNTEDADVIKFAKLYCEFSDSETEKFIAQANEDINEAKKQLAYKATLLCHGEEEAQKALETSVAIFEKGIVTDHTPTKHMDREIFEVGIAAYELFYKVELAGSKGDARRLIRGKGAKINDIVIEDENLLVKIGSFDQKQILLSAGKKKHIIVKLS